MLKEKKKLTFGWCFCSSMHPFSHRCVSSIRMQQQSCLYALLLIILMFMSCLPKNSFVTAQLNSSDKQALLDFAATVPHSRRLNWHRNSSSVCDSWVGVTCTSDDTRVIALRLPNAGFFGSLPTNTLGRLDALASLSLRNNYFTGDLPSDLLSLPSLRYVYLQQNNFSGAIPSSLSPQLVFLDMSFNSLTDNIPIAFGNLTQLTGLNLQNNSLSGSIPDFSSPRLKQLNLSNNNLNGSIPISLQSFSASSFDGNSELCGEPLDSECPSAPAPTPSPSTSTDAPSPSPYAVTTAPPPSTFIYPKSPSASYVPLPPAVTKEKNATKALSTGAVAAIAVASTSAVMFLLFLLVMALCCTKKKYTQSQGSMIKQNHTYYGAEEVSEKPKEDFEGKVQDNERSKLVFFHQYQGSVPRCNFDLEDLLRASAEVLGKGTHGTTYKVVLEDGATVVVKRLKEVAVGKEELEQLIQSAGKIEEHPNIVSLWAYYYSKDEKLHVYDFLAFSSLYKRLHGGRRGSGRALDWETRLKISEGAARGIAHIHSAADGKLSHGNIKASNILLKQDMSGCISDLGITPTLMGLTAKSNGYRAPEVNEMRKSTQKADVYSFGVVLLEMLTGKIPVIKSAAGHEEAVDLPTWVQSVVREEWTAEVFDTELLKYPNIEGGMVQMLQIAMACVETAPEMRPSMKQVVEMIEDVRQQHNLESISPSPEEP